jgi:hypothetical protein
VTAAILRASPDLSATSEEPELRGDSTLYNPNDQSDFTRVFGFGGGGGGGALDGYGGGDQELTGPFPSGHVPGLLFPSTTAADSASASAAAGMAGGTGDPRDSNSILLNAASQVQKLQSQIRAVEDDNITLVGELDLLTGRIDEMVQEQIEENDRWSVGPICSMCKYITILFNVSC